MAVNDLMDGGIKSNGLPSIAAAAAHGTPTINGSDDDRSDLAD